MELHPRTACLSPSPISKITCSENNNEQSTRNNQRPNDRRPNDENNNKSTSRRSLFTLFLQAAIKHRISVSSISLTMSQEEAPTVPDGIVLHQNKKESIISPLTNTSVASTKRTNSVNNAPTTTTKRKASAQCGGETTRKHVPLADSPAAAAAGTTKKPPPRQKAAATTAVAGTPTKKRLIECDGEESSLPENRRSPRIKRLKAAQQEEENKRRGAIQLSRKHSAVGKQPALPPVEEDEVDDGDSLFRFDEDDEGSAVLLPVDIDDAMAIADSDPSNQAKQTLVWRNAVKFEKQFVSLKKRSGKRITAVAFTKGFFHIPTISAEGELLMKRTKKEGGK